MDMEITFPGGQKVDALYKQFTIRTDQPKDKQGDDSAPSPFDLFWASIGTCMGFYVLRFLQQRSLPLEGVRLVLTTSENPSTKMTDSLDIEIHVPAGIPEKYHPALIKTADACLVKKHILEPPQFNIFIKSA